MDNPKFSLSTQKYDQATFVGRFKKMLDISDPRCMAPNFFFGVSMKESVDILDNYKKGSLDANVTDEKLWIARKIKEACIHPDTNEPVPPPFRMCGYVAFNTPILVGMLLPGWSLPMTVFWHSANQTHNAAVNYANRNASQPTPISKLLQGYVGALVSSVSIAVGVNECLRRSTFSPATKALLGRFVPFPAVATAAICNITLMRRTELETGIELYDKSGKVHGSSQIAAKEGLISTAISRFVLPIPLLMIPPIFMMQLEKSFLKRNPRMALPAQTLLCTASFLVGLPFAIALFPQEGEVQTQTLEPRFQKVIDNNGQPVHTLYYNKGL